MRQLGSRKGAIRLERDREFADSPLEGGVSCELVSEVRFPCYPGKYSELHSAAVCSAGRAVNSRSIFKGLRANSLPDRTGYFWSPSREWNLAISEFFGL